MLRAANSLSMAGAVVDGLLAAAATPAAVPEWVARMRVNTDHWLFSAVGRGCDCAAVGTQEITGLLQGAAAAPLRTLLSAPGFSCVESCVREGALGTVDVKATLSAAGSSVTAELGLEPGDGGLRVSRFILHFHNEVGKDESGSPPPLLGLEHQPEDDFNSYEHAGSQAAEAVRCELGGLLRGAATEGIGGVLRWGRRALAHTRMWCDSPVSPAAPRPCTVDEASMRLLHVLRGAVQGNAIAWDERAPGFVDWIQDLTLDAADAVPSPEPEGAKWCAEQLVSIKLTPKSGRGRTVQASACVGVNGRMCCIIGIGACVGDDARPVKTAEVARCPPRWVGEMTAASEKPGIVAQVRDSFARFFEAMHTGAVAKWAEDTVSDDFRYIMHHPDTGTQVTWGREAYLRHYNTIVEDYWGGSGSSVTYQPESFTQVTPTCVRCLFTLDVTRNPDRVSDLVVLPNAVSYKRSIVWDVGVSGGRVGTWDLWVQTTDMKLADMLGSAPKAPEERMCDLACGHNDWVSVRAKRGCAVLRCRQCSVQARVPMPNPWSRRCATFQATGMCAADAACPQLHVHPPRTRAVREAAKALME